MFRPPSFRRAFRHAASTRAALDAELREELEAHVALRADELVRRGLTPEAALAEARARFGDVDAAVGRLGAGARRRTARVRWRERLHAARSDAAVAARQLRASPAFALGVVLCLAFGIGSSVTVYSWMRGMVLRPLPAVRDVDRLVTVRFADATARRTAFVSAPEYREWREQGERGGAVTGLAAVELHLFGVQPDAAAPGAAPEPVYGMFASGNYFAVLGVRAALGRALVPADDDAPGAAAVAVLGEAYWRRRFGADSGVVGRRIRVNGYPATVVGVAPHAFGGTLAGVQFDLWVPLEARPLLIAGDAARWDARDLRTLDVIGRLAPGVPLPRGAAAFREIGRRQAAAFPETGAGDVAVTPLDVGVAQQLRPLFWSLTALTGVVLLVVCSNVANLLLVRAAARARELAVRRALGATRARLVRQLLTESAVLAALGAAGGVALAAVGGRLLAPLLPVTSVPLVVGARIDGGVLAFAAGVTALAVFAFGLAPALTASHADPGAALRGGGRGIAGARGRVRHALVVAQCALSLTALVAAALFRARADRLRAMDRGFAAPEHVLLLQTDMSFAGYGDVAAWQRTLDAAAERLRRLPGVRSAAVATYVPLGFFHPARQALAVEGYAARAGEPAGEAPRVPTNGVGPDYFATMGIPLRAGRPVTADDTPDRPGVAVVNEAFARAYLAPGSPLGRRIALGGRALTVVGVAKDGKYDYRTVDDPTPPLVYYALRQAPGGPATFHVRTTGDPAAAVAAARAAIRAVDPRVPLLAPTSLAEYTAVPMFPARVGVAVLGVLGAAALLLAAVGLSAVIAYSVALRRREVGIRLALGGTRARVVGLFVRDTLTLLGGGLAAGGPTAALAAAVLRSELSFLPAPTAGAFATPAALLGLAALVAGYLPARRSTRVDVVAVLRAE